MQEKYARYIEKINKYFKNTIREKNPNIRLQRKLHNT
jgi:hypothetical protein